MHASALALAAAAAVAAFAGALPAQRQSAAPDSTLHLSLERALRTAEANSEDVIIARAGVTRAQGQQDKAHSQFLPQISGSLSYTRTLKSQFQGLSNIGDTAAAPASCSSFTPDTTAPIGERVRLLERALGCSSTGNLFGNFSQFGFGAANQYNLGLNISQNLFTGGRITAQNRAANAGRRTADIALTSARAQVMLDVVQAYYDAALGDRLVAIAEATLAQAETTLAQTRLAKQVGNQPEFDLLRAQVTRDNQRPVVIQRRTDRDQAYLHLKQLLNLPLDQPLALTTDLSDTAAASTARLAAGLTVLPDTNVDERAPVRQARENVVAQRAAVTVAGSERIPALTISTAYGKVAFPTSTFPEWGQFLTNWTVSAGIQFPIFTGGNIRGDERIAQADLLEAQARMRRTRQLTELDTRNALAQLDAATAQFAASEGTVDQATRAYQIAEVRYREGISTQTELGDSRIQLEQAEANRAQASRDVQVARMRVALLRDLPLAGGAPPAPPTQTQPLTQPMPQSPRPPTQPSTQPGSVAAQANRVGVTP